MHVKKISTSQLKYALNLADLTNVADGQHAMQLVVSDIIASLRSAWRCEVVVNRESPIVSIAENYDYLNYPQDGAARDARYTRYVCDTALLRTQTTSMVPRVLRTIANKLPDDLLIALPGLTYRRDCVDRIHCAEPHHMDLWRIKKNSALDDDDLLNMVETWMQAILPDVQWRVTESLHPYTHNGVQIDALWRDQWLEVGECGIAHRDVIKANLSDSQNISGLAMGLGLDRILMIRKNIPDIRLLRSKDSRVVAQMSDLKPYQSVSSMPAVTRDLSIVLDNEVDNENLGDMVREALGDDSNVVEVIEIVSETTYDELSGTVRARLGINPGQKNVLVRVVLRSLDRTLSHEECNQYRDEIYQAIHHGTEWHWATKEPNKNNVVKRG
ncbi:MAG: hypothetical protein HKM24_01745 [Gammaproteobacteria bacterium]|nr:hypothetical protein [Gammaproteobacteria bacterium]